MALVKLLVERARGAVNHASTLYGRAIANILRPTQHVFIATGIKELGGVINVPQHHVTVPWPDGHIGDGVLFSRHKTAAGKLLVEHVKLAFGFHRKAVDRVFDFHRRIAEEMAKAAAEERGRAL
ncbi:Uncharacterised protein [Klebsiella pneumoniae]|nr:Uncharacterised protein [Klebsiella pneumoniae]